MQQFQAFRIHDEGGNTRAGLETVDLNELSSGEVVIEAHYSSVNYKDALAGTGKGKIMRSSPLVGGIDVSGVVSSSEDGRFKTGDAVLVTGCGARRWLCRICAREGGLGHPIARKSGLFSGHGDRHGRVYRCVGDQTTGRQLSVERCRPRFGYWRDRWRG
jgi:NADPH:quinone reductase-like Zn-dependent oxidoreductase